MKLLLTRFTPLLSATLFFLSCTKNNIQPIAPLLPSFTSSTSSDVKVMSNIIYAININWLGHKQALGLDIYFPVKEIEVSKFPLIVYFHGGGYVTGTKEMTKEQCNILASKGFIVASVDYRTGWTQDPVNQCESDETEAVEAFYRAQQDGRAALRFLVANADEYSINTDWIFVAGQSAGASISLAVVYETQDTINYYLPGIAEKLGLLNSAGNTLKDKYNIKGIGSLWGGIEFSLNIITPENATPTILFHGMLDEVVPWNIGYVFGCNNFPENFGSKQIYSRLISYGVPAVAHIDPNGGHGIYTDRFNMESLGCFFGSIMRNSPQKGYYTTKVSNCK